LASKSPTGALPCPNSSLIEGDLSKAVAALRKRNSKDVVILGSGTVVRKLLADQFVDELVLLIHPLVLGSGQRLFDDNGAGAFFELADTRTTGTGVIAATYSRAELGPFVNAK
jgi:dihydrofolate reductase